MNFTRSRKKKVKGLEKENLQLNQERTGQGNLDLRSA